MTARKRKSPDRGKPAGREPGLARRLAAALAGGLARFAMRHRRPLFAIAVFAVVFGFIAANALWYQPGSHPSPFLATREPDDPHAIAGLRAQNRPSEEEVTTFRIERAAPEAGAEADAAQADKRPAPETVSSIGPRNREQAHAGSREQAVSPQPLPPPAMVVPRHRPLTRSDLGGDDPVAVAIRDSSRPTAGKPAGKPSASPAAPKPAPAADDLVAQIQRGLANIAYGDVVVDGIAGTQTKAAIRSFERHYRLAETGEPNPAVLKKLKEIGAL